MIVTASSSSPVLALNPIVSSNNLEQKVIEQSYSVERPNSESGAKIYNLVIKKAKENELDADLALRIARCESLFRQFNSDGSVLRGKQNPDDVGVFQINEKYHLSRSQALGLDIETSADNISYAMYLMKKEGAKPWNWSKPCWGGENYLKTNA